MLNKERNWWIVVVVTLAVIIAGLVAAWQTARTPVLSLSQSASQALYESNWANFGLTCLAPKDYVAAGLKDFCREEGLLIQRMPECGADCQLRTSSFTVPQPSR